MQQSDKAFAPTVREMMKAASHRALAGWVLKHLDWSGGNSDENAEFLTAILEQAWEQASASSSEAHIVQVQPMPPQPEVVTTTTGPLGPVAYGEPRQNYPGGPIYRVGTSGGAAPVPEVAQSETPRTDERMREVQALYQTVDWNESDAGVNVQNRALCMVEEHARQLERELADMTESSARNYALFEQAQNRAASPSTAHTVPGSPDEMYEAWLEDELMEVVRIACPPQEGDDHLTDAIKLHAIRLLVEADAERYEAAFDRWLKRHPNAEPLRTITAARSSVADIVAALRAVSMRDDGDGKPCWCITDLRSGLYVNDHAAYCLLARKAIS